MIWKWADRKDDRFVTFNHHDQRIAALEEGQTSLEIDQTALETDITDLSKVLLDYLEAHDSPAKQTAETLRKIIRRREDAGSAAK